MDEQFRRVKGGDPDWDKVEANKVCKPKPKPKIKEKDVFKPPEAARGARAAGQAAVRKS